MDQWKQKIQELAALYGLKVLAALAILVVGRWLAKGVIRLIRRVLTKRELDPTIVNFGANLGYIALMTFVIIAALAQVGIQTSSFIAVIGAAGLAIGLALQGSLASFAAGLLIIIFRPFKLGDIVEAAGVTGVVEEIQVFSTKLRTPDNTVIIIPNSKVTGANITNFTAKETRRCDLTFGVSYSDDIDKVRSLIKKVSDADARVLKDPAPQIVVGELAESRVIFTVRVWVKVGDYWDVYFDTIENVKKTFDAKGVSIPFPQRDLRIFRHQAAAPERGVTGRTTVAPLGSRRD